MRDLTSSTALSSGTVVPFPSQAGTVITKEYSYLTVGFSIVAVMLAMASGFASFNGMQLFLSEVGGSSVITKGTSLMLTLSIVTILGVGWAALLRVAPGMPTLVLRARMAFLGLALMALTLAASTTSNLAALVGPPAKVHAWKLTHMEHVLLTNRLEGSVLGIDKILPGWRAQAAESCKLADLELKGGVVSGTGAGQGPVAAGFARVCEQSKSFVTSMEQARDAALEGVTTAQSALAEMQAAIRDRESEIPLREDRFLDAGVALNRALQTIRAADLTDVMDAGAAQLQASVAELSDNTAFSSRQAESVAGIKTGLSGLVASTGLITDRLRGDPIPPQQAITSPDLIEAVRQHGLRFLPMAAAAFALDLFNLWAMFFLMTARAGALRLEGPQSARTRPTA